MVLGECRFSVLTVWTGHSAQKRPWPIFSQYGPTCLVRLQVIYYTDENVKETEFQAHNSDWEPTRHMLTFHAKQNRRERELRKKKRNRCVKAEILRDHSGE